MSPMYNRPINPNMANKPMDKRSLMMRIYELGLALTETVMFLDTHPTDPEAINFYCEVKEKYNQAVETYSECYGPLLASNVSNENYWMWVATPMPWELEGN